MTNDIQIFDNPEFGKIRTMECFGNPYFVGKDVAQVLGYSNPQKAIRDHVDEEDKTVNDLFTVNGTAGGAFVYPPAAYAVAPRRQSWRRK